MKCSAGRRRRLQRPGAVHRAARRTSATFDLRAGRGQAEAVGRHRAPGVRGVRVARRADRPGRRGEAAGEADRREAEAAGRHRRRSSANASFVERAPAEVVQQQRETGGRAGEPDSDAGSEPRTNYVPRRARTACRPLPGPGRGRSHKQWRPWLPIRQAGATAAGRLCQGLRSVRAAHDQLRAAHRHRCPAPP